MGLNFKFLFESFFVVLRGIPVTMLVVLFSIAVSFPLGFLLALLVNKKIPILSRLGAVFVSFMRGTPMIIQLYVVYCSLPSILMLLFTKLGIPVDAFNLNPLIFAMVVYPLNTMAVFCEIFRSALTTVGREQMEAALTVGLTEKQSYIRVIIPQMMEAACANLSTACIGLIKNSTLMFYLTIMDVMGIIKVAAAENYDYMEGYTLAFIIYLGLCYAMEFAWFFIEKRLKTKKFRESEENYA